MSDLNNMVLEEITEIIVDCPHSTPIWTEEGFIVLRNQNIRDGRLNLSNPSFTNEKGYEARVKRAIPKAGDLVFTREAPMGEVCMIPENLTCCLGQRMVLIRPDTHVVDGKYLLFAFQGPNLKHQISWNEGTGTTVSNIRIPSIKGFSFNLPSLKEQKAISHILGTLDDKIELNRQMNQTLEAMAQALFKSWFVDFDPVIDNALEADGQIPEALQARAEKRKALLDRHSEGGTTEESPQYGAPLFYSNSALAALFPSSFEYNETLDKWIPEGWAVKSLGDITTELRRGISPKYIDDGGIRVLNQKCIRNHEIDFNLARRNDPEKKNVDGRLLEVGDMVVNSTGTGTLGRVANIISLEEPTVVDSHVTVLRANTDFILVKYFNALLFSLETTIEAMGEGSTGQTELSRLRLSELNVLLAPKEIQKYADKAFDNFFDKMESNRIQNQTLTQLRDTLLPQLISGKVRLPEEML